MKKNSGLKKCIIFNILLAFCCLSVFAQNNENPIGKVTISSPNSASLGKYADFPVSLNTGTPNINIPLLTVTEGNLNLPISISYHAGGLKVAEAASWVGAGFSLNAGGMITRTVRGGVDEIGDGIVTSQSKGYYTNYGYDNNMFDPCAPSSGGNSPSGLCPDEGMWFTGFYFRNGEYDGEPDLFTYNFNGYSGKFYFNDDRTPILVPEQDFKIEVSNITGRQFTGFKIIVSDGTKYYFGQNRTPSNGGVDAIEKSSSYDSKSSSGVQYGTAYSSWYMTQIESADGKFSISLKYAEEKYGAYVTSMFPLDKNLVETEKEYHLVKNHIKGVRLSSIVTTNQTITLIPGDARLDLSSFDPASQSAYDGPNTEAKTLSEIQITNANQSCRKYKFNYDYFVDNSTILPSGYDASTYNITSDRKKLKLEKIQEMNCNETKIIPAYSFSYFPGIVSRSLSFAQDHWGFYNGAVNNTRLIPTYRTDEFTVRPGADRDSHWPEMRNGALEKITFPTGGSSTFDFEANSTWLSYTDYVPTISFTTSVGYDGSSSITYNDKYFSSNPYEIKLSNSVCGNASANCGASVVVQNSSGLASAASGEITKTYFTTTPGIHQIYMSKNNVSTGYGASATFTELIPTLIQRNEIVGGLRIKTSTTTDANSLSNPIITSFSYTENGGSNSSGHLYSKPVYISVLRNDILGRAGFSNDRSDNEDPFQSGCPQPHVPPNNSNFNLRYLVSPSSIIPMATLQGNHIGYNEVKEFYSNNGFKLNRFFGSSTFDIDKTDVCIRKARVTGLCDPALINWPYVPVPFEYKRGDLKYEGFFDTNGRLLKERHISTHYVENTLVTPGMINSREQEVGLTSFYYLKTMHKLYEETNIVEYDGNATGFLKTTIRYFEKKNSPLVTREIVNDSKGFTNETRIKYSSDFLPNSCLNLSDGISTYSNSVIIANQSYESLMPCVTSPPWPSSTPCKWVLNQKNLRDLNLARIAFINYRRTNFTNPTNNYKTAFDNAEANADADLKPILALQRLNINVPIEVTTYKNGNLVSSVFNKYVNSVFNPSFPYLEKQERLNVNTPINNFSPVSFTSNSLIKDSRYEPEVEVKYENGQIVEVKGKDGITSSYIWEYNNTLPVVKAAGIPYTNLRAAYNNFNGDISLLYAQPTLANAFIKTYQYNPGVGIIRETDENGKNSFYEYDDLNRLYLIRDKDNNILKKYCYNYVGQPVDCTAPCTNFTPNWQNTAEFRCVTSTCGNTGVREQKQIDANPCNNGAEQWVVVETNSSSCPAPSGLVTITYNNLANYGPFVATYTNLASGQTFTFAVPASGSGVLGCVPTGGYNLTVTANNGNTVHPQMLFGSGCAIISGSSATFRIRNISFCANLSIDYDY